MCIRDSQYEGQGKYYNSEEKLIYSGQFTSGVYSGQGVEYWPNQEIKYEGAFEMCIRDSPYIVARGRKGGSNVAAAICNALLYLLGRD